MFVSVFDRILERGVLRQCPPAFRALLVGAERHGGRWSAVDHGQRADTGDSLGAGGKCPPNTDDM